MRGSGYETTVHDKRTGQPVRGCDGDAVAEVERLEREYDEATQELATELAEERILVERRGAALKRIEAGPVHPEAGCPASRSMQEIARSALSPDDSRNVEN